MNQNPVRNRIATFLLLCGSLATIILTVVITQRLSDDALSLTLGIVLGVVALLIPMLVVAALLYLVTRATEARATFRGTHAPAPSQQPPILVLTPSGYQQPQLEAASSGNRYPAYNPQHATSQAALGGFRYPGSGPQRNFTIIGGE